MLSFDIYDQPNYLGVIGLEHSNVQFQGLLDWLIAQPFGKANPPNTACGTWYRNNPISLLIERSIRDILVQWDNNKFAKMGFNHTLYDEGRGEVSFPATRNFVFINTAESLVFKYFDSWNKRLKTPPKRNYEILQIS